MIQTSSKKFTKCVQTVDIAFRSIVQEHESCENRRFKERPEYSHIFFLPEVKIDMNFISKSQLEFDRGRLCGNVWEEDAVFCRMRES